MNKRMLNKLTLFGLIAILAISFSACDKETEYAPTEINFGGDAYVDRRDGYFELYLQVTEYDISGFRPAREELLRVDAISSWLAIYLPYSDDRIRGLEIVMDRDLVYRHGDVIGSGRDNRFYIENNVYKGLMREALSRLSYKHGIDIVVSGYSDRTSGRPEYAFDFYNNVDIAVRY